MRNFRFSRKQLCIPYALFLVCFVILPLAVIVYYAFTDGSGRFTAANFLNFFTNGNTIGTLCYSAVIAVAVTAVCLLIAYPVAYILARSGLKRAPVLLMLFILPMWINFTLRVTALKEILTVLEGNLSLHPFLNTVIAMTYDYLPFMILPLYTAMTKIDDSIIEAAQDLGCNTFRILLRVLIPLSGPGIATGITMVFVPAVSTFIISRMLGGGSNLLIGDLIELQFLGNSYNLNLGSAMSLALMVIVLLCMSFTSSFDEEEMEGVM